MGNAPNLEEIREKVSVNGLIISCHNMSEQSQKRLTELCHSKGIFSKRFIVNLQDVNNEQGPS
jgi:hypothetical protein